MTHSSLFCQTTLFVARCLLLVAVLGLPPASAQTLEFKSSIKQETILAGVSHAAWSPNGAHLYAVADQDHTLIQFIPDIDGSLTVGQVLRDGVDGVDGLEGASGVGLSPTGDHVYVAGFVDDAVAVFSRDGGTGELTFVEAVKNGVGGVDGLDGATFVVVSADGAHVYVAGAADDAVAAFSRDGATGQLTFVQAFRRLGNFGTPRLSGARQVAISPDGATVYAVAPSSSSLVVLSRDATTGMLTFVEFFERLGLFGTPEPNEIDGLDGVRSVAVSPDGTNVYVVSRFDDAIVVFDRDAGDGTLTHTQTLEDGVEGVEGLNGAVYVSVSPDGANVYVAAGVDDAVSTFDRDGTTGMLTFAATQPGGVAGLNLVESAIVNPDGTLVHGISGSDRTIVAFTRDTGTGALAFSAIRDEPPGDVIGLSRIQSLVIDASGTVVYTAGAQDNAIGVFSLDPIDGTLAFVEAQQNGVNGVEGLTEVKDLVISPDRRFVYAISPVDDAIALFEVVGPNGELQFLKAIRNGGAVSGLNDPQSLAISPDGRHLYVSGPADNALVVFARKFLSGDLVYIETLRNDVDFTGMSLPGSIAVSPDGTLVLVVSAISSDIEAFLRDPETGRLVHEPTATAKGFGAAAQQAEPDATTKGSGSGAIAARRIVITPDGFTFFVIAGSPQKLLVFVVDLSSGQLVLTQIQEIPDTGSGIAVSQDGTRVFVTDADTGEVQTWLRDPETGFIEQTGTAVAVDEMDSIIDELTPIVVDLGTPGFAYAGSPGEATMAQFAPDEPTPKKIDVSIFKLRLGLDQFRIIVSNKPDSSTARVFVEDLLPGFALDSSRWTVFSSTVAELPEGSSEKGDLRLEFSMEPGGRIVFDYLIEVPDNSRYINRATVSVVDGEDSNPDDNTFVTTNKPLPVHADSFESAGLLLFGDQ